MVSLKKIISVTASVFLMAYTVLLISILIDAPFKHLNNRYIKVEGFSVYYKTWHEAGVTKIEDIFQDNAFLPFNDFCNKFKIKTNFLKYYGLCHAVPQKWVDILKGKVVAPVEKNADQDNIPLHQLSCKLTTKFLVKNKFVIPTAERRMRKANLNEVTIQRIFSLPFKVTKDTKLSIFQYKIIHHILPTNATLYRDSLKEHDKCHLCKEKETLTHLFVTCPTVQILWSIFVDWWNSKNRDEINLDETNIIYGVTTNFPLRLGLNLCLIIAKHYIYTASRKEEDYYWDAFMAILTNKLEIEKHKAKLQITI